MILNNPLPSPLNKDEEIDDDIFKEPVICTFPKTCIGELDCDTIKFVCMPEAVNLPTIFTDSDEKLAILLPLTNNATKDELS